MSKFIIFFIIFLIFIPFITGNTGCWQFKNNYKVLLWSVPISPYVNEEAQFTLNFVHDDKLMNDLEFANVWVDKGGDIIKKFDKLEVNDGFANLSYKFDEARFYEIYVEFKPNKSNESIKLDFPYEVKEKIKKIDYFKLIIMFIFVIFVGLLVRIRK